MSNIIIREPAIEDEKAFITAMQESESLHQAWVKPPVTSQAFAEYLNRSQQENHKSFLVCNDLGKIVGVFNLNEIIRGSFQNAFLGFYAVADYARQGLMSVSLKKILAIAFHELKLHRLEANIQYDNFKSIELVQANGFRYEGFSPRYLKINDQWLGHDRWAITFEDYIQNNKEVLAQDIIEIVPYNSNWPTAAENEIAKIKAILPANCMIDIQHVGSTAIPGISAKPIIDIQIAAKSLDTMKMLTIPLLQKLGYEYWANNPDPERMFFAKGMPPYGQKRTHHLHIVEPTSKHWIDKIQFRDYLISHPDVAKKYEQLKTKLAMENSTDREGYTEAKGEFVAKILQLGNKFSR